MHRLTHFPLCPFSRSIRLALAELGLAFEGVEERPWEWRPEFLALNPAGDLPVLMMDDGVLLCGAYAISEYLSDRYDTVPGDGLGAMFPGEPADRAEVRRLVDWFHRKVDREVTREVLRERAYPRLQDDERRPPDVSAMRAMRSNLRYHLSYLGFLADQRNWLAGEALTFADLAAAAHLSVLDYMGEIPWEDFPAATTYYQRIKSRPSFRPLLADRLRGIAPPAHYADLDF